MFKKLVITRLSPARNKTICNHDNRLDQFLHVLKRTRQWLLNSEPSLSYIHVILTAMSDLSEIIQSPGLLTRPAKLERHPVSRSFEIYSYIHESITAAENKGYS